MESLLGTLAGSPWTYLVILTVAAADVLLPLLPSEATVILGGVLASSFGDLHLLAVILAALAGAVAGDHLAYWLGRLLGSRVTQRFASGTRGQQMLGWAERQLALRGGTLIVSSRFIPGGRTAATLTAGMLEMPWRRFLAFDLAAGALWATYCALLGYFGGRIFREDPLIAIGLAIATTTALGAVIEVIRARRVTQPT